jgi:hypothetical protein
MDPGMPKISNVYEGKINFDKATTMMAVQDEDKGQKGILARLEAFKNY